MTRRFLLILNICLLTQTVFSQSQNREANHWYRLALEEATQAGAMLALQKAIAIDPKFVEALLRLGRAYNQTEQFKQARTYLLRAYSARLARIDKSLKSDILYELALTYKFLDETKASEDAFRGAYGLTNSEALRSKISLELGEILFRKGRYSEAVAELSQCRELASKDQAYLDQLLNVTSKSLEVEKLYRLARQAEDNRQNAKAIGIYRKVEGSMPGFRDAQRRIDLLTADSANPAHVAATVEIAPVKPVRSEMAQALPPPRQTQSFADQTPATRTTQPEAVKVRSPAEISHREQNTAATPHLERHRPGEPVYPAWQTQRPAKIEAGSPTNRRQERPAVQRYDAEPSPLRKRKPSTHAPAYRSTFKANANEPEAKQDSSRRCLLGSLATGLLALPILGLVVASPTVRARIFLLLGLPRRAVPIYERILLKRPNALWLYPSLAKLYYSDDRHDEQAMSVYRMLQHLNANSRANDSLTANILNKYLSNGETTPVQIDILENIPTKQRLRQ